MYIIAFYTFETAIPIQVVGKMEYWMAQNLVAQWQAKRRKVPGRRFTRVCAPGLEERKGQILELCKDPIMSEALTSALCLGLGEVKLKLKEDSDTWLSCMAIYFPRLIRWEWIIEILRSIEPSDFVDSATLQSKQGGLRNRRIINHAKLLFPSILKPKFMLDKQKILMSLLGSSPLGKSNLFFIDPLAKKIL